ncbi:RagB/SusD family nutrient uptake outer membrane protein [Bacteroides salyersiae]|jgi:tetratricopeptide (TPR) repeat protein|uniref:RagB/SusD family nutrient uptake outer membrane protein n=1 Tax=Bacteroides salyersiae TaxID=291644 RepID=UPI001C8C06D4|nr:RagB/SusD family nutrient uptake outer membrane protein [Bacteroides salyersiae]
MKNQNKYSIGLAAIAMLLATSSCEGFLDKMPDNRTELDNSEKVLQLLVSAYPSGTYMQITELMSDNVADNGPLYMTFNKSVEESYKWQDFTDNQQDTPQYIWNEYYKAIAAANHALEYLNNSEEETEDELASRGEALVCRAYSHFILVNVFCKAYNPQTSSVDLGVPYVEKPEKIVSGQYARGTVAEVYEKINRDIEEGLPLIDDTKYKSSVIKYHFNQKAAYAFAARFNLYYGNYEKAIKYATKAIGENPAKVLRDQVQYKSIAAAKDCGIAYVKSELACNLLLMPATSMWNYNHWRSQYSRYAMNTAKLQTTYWSLGPWVTPEYLYQALKIYGNDQVSYYPKLYGFIEYTDVISGIGYLNIVNTVFTTDETLLCRAEAYIHMKDYSNATKDLSYWYDSHTLPGVKALTEARIDSYYETADQTVRPELHPMFEIEPGKQLNFMYCLLHFRRIETVHEGLRWFDIKRFGIEIEHNIAGQANDILTKDDPRRALQLPADVIGAGMQPNPR